MAINWETILGNSGIYISGIDIGCSSGRPHEWERLGSALKYVGVDPLTSEVQRLRGLKEKSSTFIDAFIDFPNAKGHADAETSDLFVRTSAYSFSEEKFDSQKEIYNAGKKVTITENRILVHDLLADNNIECLDLLKIDIDGDDFLCMKEFGRLGQLKELLSLQIESQFHGENSELGNTLWNIGKEANKNDLHLFDLSINRYSRKGLPSKFLYSFPAQTSHGQAMWGDSLFMKDSKRSDLSEIQLVKLIAIYEIHGFYDCAHELIQENSQKLNKLIPLQLIANSLAESHSKREEKKEEQSIFDNFFIKRLLRRLR
jgi:hypothetical protein